jgi:hypothetical protein
VTQLIACEAKRAPGTSACRQVYGRKRVFDGRLPGAMHSDYIIFVDESGDHSLAPINPDYPVFVLAFCLMPFKAYNEQVAPAVRALKFALFGHDVVILHEHDIRKRKGPFSNLGPLQREALLEGLTSIIQAAPMTIISVAINKQKLASRYVRPAHPYNLALMFGLERVNQFLRMQGQHERLTYVICEARGAKEDRELELEFRRVCDGNSPGGSRFLLEVVFADKRTNSEGLQLADLVARPIGLQVLRPGQPNHAWDVILGKLFRGIAGSTVYGNGFKVFP